MPKGGKSIWVQSAIPVEFMEPDMDVIMSAMQPGMVDARKQAVSNRTATLDDMTENLSEDSGTCTRGSQSV